MGFSKTIEYLLFKFFNFKIFGIKTGIFSIFLNQNLFFINQFVSIVL